MAEDNVIPFRPRPPSDRELDAPQMRQLMFPRHFEQDLPVTAEKDSPDGK
jgi:hypothetical protein